MAVSNEISMKKNILFICCDMGKGGVSKSLANLLNCIDYTKYEVDLFLFKQTGLFLNQIPEKVNLLPENEKIRNLIKNGKVIKVIKAVVATKLGEKETDLEKKWALYWKNNKNIFQKNNKQYDVAISYNDGVELYYMVDCVNAKRKIAYNHTNYTNEFIYKPKLDKWYFSQVDDIVTVSETCKETLSKVFPEIKGKIYVIENIVKKDLLQAMAGECDPFIDIRKLDSSIKIIVTVAGLYMRKGFDLAAETLSKIKNKGYKFKWYIIGNGPDEKGVKEIIEKAQIIEETELLYEQPNPYKYMKWADVFMLTSYAEGKSIAVEEAKLLEVPILITKYSSAEDQIKNNISGLIAELNAESIAKNLEMLLKEETLIRSLKRYLKENVTSNESSNMEKFYDLLDSPVK